MHRVADALRRSSPYEVVENRDEADIEFVHAVGVRDLTGYIDAIRRAGRKVVLIQYCFLSGGTVEQWREIWDRVDAVWSYLPRLDAHLGTKLQLSPLGADDVFTKMTVEQTMSRTRESVMTSGFVSGFGAEAIDEFTRAASRLSLPVYHLGPENVEGMTFKPANWRALNGIADRALAQVYTKTKAVSGLRWVEGFELPALEGLVLGARPVMFKRADASIWFNDFARYVPEKGPGEPLIESIMETLRSIEPVSSDEIKAARNLFDWSRIMGEVWRHVRRI